MNSSSKISPINTKTFALKSEFYSTDSQVQIVNISDKLITTYNALNETLPSAEKEIVKTKATQKLLADPDKSQ